MLYYIVWYYIIWYSNSSLCDIIITCCITVCSNIISRHQRDRRFPWGDCPRRHRRRDASCVRPGRREPAPPGQLARPKGHNEEDPGEKGHGSRMDMWPRQPRQNATAPRCCDGQRGRCCRSPGPTWPLRPLREGRRRPNSPGPRAGLGSYYYYYYYYY